MFLSQDPAAASPSAWVRCGVPDAASARRIVTKSQRIVTTWPRRDYQVPNRRVRLRQGRSLAHDDVAQEGDPMQPRGHSARVNLPLLMPVLALGIMLAVGCGGSSSTSTQAKVTPCGQAKTAANVPIHIEIVNGQFSCQTALAIEKKYDVAVRSGHAPGNGGGGPVKIDGWTCQGFSTPVVLHTGKASKCVKGADEILAILPSTT
jgi:hypothetical protein